MLTIRARTINRRQKMNQAAFLAFFSEGCVMPMVLIKVLEIASRSFIMAYPSRLDGSRGGMS
jgi:hypothetical protein